MGKSPVDVNALLAAAASAKKPSKSKSKTPEVMITGLDADVARWLKAKQDEANAKAEMVQAEEVILPKALKARKDVCRGMGSFESSVVVNQALLISTQNKYSPIDAEAQQELEIAFGEEWETFFKKETEITLTKKATEDAEGLRKIIEAIGVDKFSDFLSVRIFYKPTEALHHGIVMDEKVDNKAAKLLEKGLLKPYKASIKAK